LFDDVSLSFVRRQFLCLSATTISLSDDVSPPTKELEGRRPLGSFVHDGSGSAYEDGIPRKTPSCGSAQGCSCYFVFFVIEVT